MRNLLWKLVSRRFCLVFAELGQRVVTAARIIGVTSTTTRFWIFSPTPIFVRMMAVWIFGKVIDSAAKPFGIWLISIFLRVSHYSPGWWTFEWNSIRIGKFGFLWFRQLALELSERTFSRCIFESGHQMQPMWHQLQCASSDFIVNLGRSLYWKFSVKDRIKIK